MESSVTGTYTLSVYSADDNGIVGSRKHLLSSLDQSLQRLQLSDVGIFYSHRPEPEKPVEETMLALDTAVRSRSALYAASPIVRPPTAALEAIAIA
jgi:L-glyceraldehyde 3-phosphate reductase